MSKDVVKVENLLKDITLTMDDYVKGVDGVLFEVSLQTGYSAEEELHRTSPARTGNYRKSWTFGQKEIKKGKSYRTELVVYNAKYYRLTHLLEKSHRIANKYGSYGMSKPQPHIAPAQKHAEETFLKLFKEELQRIRV